MIVKIIQDWESNYITRYIYIYSKGTSILWSKSDATEGQMSIFVKITFLVYCICVYVRNKKSTKLIIKDIYKKKL